MAHRKMKEECASCGKTFEFYSDECYNCKQSPTTWKCNGGNCDFVAFVCEDCEANVIIEDAYDRYKEHGDESWN